MVYRTVSSQVTWGQTAVVQAVSNRTQHTVGKGPHTQQCRLRQTSSESVPRCWSGQAVHMAVRCSTTNMLNRL
jgi:hypothetical protein